MPPSPGHDGEPDTHGVAAHSDAPKQDGPDATVTPSAQLPALDPRALAALGEVGQELGGLHAAARGLGARAARRPATSFRRSAAVARGRFVQVRSAPRRARRRRARSDRRGGQGDSRSARVAYALRQVLIGPALRSTAIAEQRMGRLLALAVLSPDALSSVAYGPAAMLACSCSPARAT